MPTVFGPYLHSGLCEIDSTGQILSHEGVRVVRPLEHSLQRLQLAAVERGPVPPLLTLLLLLRVQLFICPHRHKHQSISFKITDVMLPIRRVGRDALATPSISSVVKMATMI